MPTLEYLRHFRFASYAIFDLLVSFWGIYLLSPLLSRLFCQNRCARAQAELALPDLAHWHFGALASWHFDSDDQKFLGSTGSFRSQGGDCVDDMAGFERGEVAAQIVLSKMQIHNQIGVDRFFDRFLI